jgi:hypothetical protein
MRQVTDPAITCFCDANKYPIIEIDDCAKGRPT